MAASGDTAIGSLDNPDFRPQIPVDKGQRSTGKPLRTPPRHTFRRAGRLDENAEPSRTTVRRQAAYVSPATRVACLPKLQEDVTRILNTSVPGCILPKFGHANVRNHTAPDEEDCDVAARLYHEDFEIWRAHCGN